MYPSYDAEDFAKMKVNAGRGGVSCDTCQCNGACRYSNRPNRQEKHNCPDWAERTKQNEAEAIADITARGGDDASAIFEVLKALGDDWQAAFSRTIAWLNRIR